MAMEIRPTPKLNKKQTEKFLSMVEADMDKPSPSNLDPRKIDQARQKALKLAKSQA